MSALRVDAELRRLAAELTCEVDDVAFLAPLGVDGVRELRATLERALDERYRPVFRRIEASSRHLPAPLVAKLASTFFGSLVLGRTATELSAERARKVLPHVPVETMARCAPYMDPERGQHLIRALPHDLLIPVSRQVIADGDHAAMGRLLGALPEDLVPSLVPLLTDGRGLVLVGFHCEGADGLARVIGHLDEAQIVAAGEAALADGLEAELQDVLDRLPAEQERRLRDGAPTELVRRLEARVES